VVRLSDGVRWSCGQVSGVKTVKQSSDQAVRSLLIWGGGDQALGWSVGKLVHLSVCQGLRWSGGQLVILPVGQQVRWSVGQVVRW
jgi:hypothetical protein